jgi:hypothetical protein
MVYIGVVWARRRYLRNGMGEEMGVRGKREGGRARLARELLVV